MSFDEKLKSYEPFPITIAKIGGGVSLQNIDAPRILAVEGRGVGICDALTAAVFLDALESMRLLGAIYDTLVEVCLASDQKDDAAGKAALLALMGRGGAMQRVAEHMKATDERTEAAKRELRVARGEEEVH